MATTLDYFKLHFIVFLWGFTAILGALVSIPSVEMVLYRIVLSIAGMGLTIVITKKSLAVGTADLVKLLLTGFIVAAHWITFFVSARISNISVCLVGLSTASLWTAILEPLTLGKKIRVLEIFLGCLVILGLYVMLHNGFRFKLGLIIGILAGLSTATFSVINARLVRRVNQYSITFYEMAGALVGTSLFLPFYKYAWAENGTLRFGATGLDWIYISILALICTVYAFSTMVELMQRISVFFIQLTINLEPVYGIILAVILFKEKEKMDVNFYLGTLIILSAVLSYPLLKRRFANSSLYR